MTSQNIYTKTTDGMVSVTAYSYDVAKAFGMKATERTERLLGWPDDLMREWTTEIVGSAPELSYTERLWIGEG